MESDVSTQQYPERGSVWLVTYPLRDVRKRVLMEVIGSGHGSVIAQRVGTPTLERFGILGWASMNPVRNWRRLSPHA
jgi:hypothetical protein